MLAYTRASGIARNYLTSIVFRKVFILNSFLGTDNLFYGFHILKDLLNGREWEVSGNFPRVTMCDFEHMKFIRKYLRATDLATDRQSVKKFVHKFLGFDGVFCMRMISAHAGDIMATELIVALWHNFNDRVRKSPIEMFEGGVSQSPSKLDANFKTWLLGQTRYASALQKH
ncbi:Innexin [Teladorsagia circumcincta]|uniref:Innexin n=1 Tax=Teladorsagia circumcincta TaxID=45464 RepID=A0A2G9UHM2_TELCI|nr:Innexin [Teladorsagia circumcincta]